MKRLLFLLFASTALYAQFAPKDYSNLIGIPGFSDNALKLHFTLYKGYVTNTNKIQELLEKEDPKSPVYAELKRRQGWEFDGMRLHELYFENLGGKDSLDPNSPLAKQLTTDFGSFDAWKKDFIATGSMRGIGWSILYKDPISNKLINTWINEHDVGHLAGSTPLLIMDVFEHAYLPDYGLDRAKYIDAFFQNINWTAVQKRYS